MLKTPTLLAACLLLAACHGNTGPTPAAADLYPEAPIEAYVNEPSAFHCGRAAICVDDRYGYMDRQGRIVIPCVYAAAHPFSEGYAIVRDDSTGLCSYIDTLGHVVSSVTFASGWEARDGMGRIHRDPAGQHKAYIDLSTGRVIDVDYDSFGDFSEGLACVGEGRDYSTRRYGYIDHEGRQVIGCTYSDGSAFSDGLAMVKQGRQTAYIDRDGTPVIPLAEYYTARPFSQGLAFVADIDEHYDLHGRYIDHAGNTVITGGMLGGEFRDGYAVLLDDQYVIIDHQGRRLFDHRYELIREDFDGGYTLALSQGKWHVIDLQGRVRLADVSLSGDNDPTLSEGMLLVKRGTIWTYCDLDGNILLPHNPEDAPASVSLPEVQHAQPDPAMGEVWTAIGGDYPFCGEDGCVRVSSDGVMSIYGEDYEALIDDVTGEIQAFDAAHRLIFSGYMYAGGNMLAGNLGNDVVVLSGMGGM